MDSSKTLSNNVQYGVIITIIVHNSEDSARDCGGDFAVENIGFRYLLNPIRIKGAESAPPQSFHPIFLLKCV